MNALANRLKERTCPDVYKRITDNCQVSYFRTSYNAIASITVYGLSSEGFSCFALTSTNRMCNDYKNAIPKFRITFAMITSVVMNAGNQKIRYTSNQKDKR